MEYTFYHGMLLELLRSEINWLILSNAESVDGFSDILIEPEDPDAGSAVKWYARGTGDLNSEKPELIFQFWLFCSDFLRKMKPEQSLP